MVLSGGSGTRLWPLSRELYPKQLLPLVGEQTMLQETALRLEGVEDAAAPLIVCNEEHRFLVAEQLRQVHLDATAIVLEPAARNTAPAVALAALVAPGRLAEDDDPLLLVLPADHVIRDVDALHSAIAAALPLAKAGKLVTFGVHATSPKTGYGYIHAAAADGNGALAVEKFVEKPDAEKAARYVEAGDYYWNSGMFMFRASRYLEELKRFEPDMVAACSAACEAAREDLDFLRVDPEAFAACPRNSVDYAVMERTADAVVVPLDAGWSDVGDWSSLYAAHPADGEGNVCIGDVVSVDSRDSYLYASERMVAAVGVRDHVVIETADAVLVAPKTHVQDVKKLVMQLRRERRSEAELHRRVYRPWGSYESIDVGDRYQVKRLTVKPGAVLSLQMHHHRAEHWIVVRGTAEITRGDEVFMLTENQSTYIPIGARHRIANPGTLPLDIIEVQSGGYLGEDDIVRFEDNYGRAQ